MARMESGAGGELWKCKRVLVGTFVGRDWHVCDWRCYEQRSNKENDCEGDTACRVPFFCGMGGSRGSGFCGLREERSEIDT